MTQETHQKLQRFTLFLFLGLILITIVGGAMSPVMAKINRGERIPVVVFGIDAAGKSQHTDTLMLGVFDPLTRYLSVLSVPRDTLINLRGYRFRRINEIYGYEFRRTQDWLASAKLVISGVEELLSSDAGRISIPYVLQADYSGFKKVVNLLGGVWVNVKEPMNYDDNAGDTHIHFEPGRHLLKGEQALNYVRFRGFSGDRGRIFRQQEFMRSMALRLMNPGMVMKIPSLISILVSSLHSNMNLWDMVYFAASARHLRAGDLHFYLLPGKPSGPYWAADKPLTQELASSLITGKAVTDKTTQAILPQAARVTVNVWNASGQSGLAYQITRFLRQRGFDVVEWGTYPAEQVQTRVVDRRGKIAGAQAVAAELGVESYHSEPNPKSLVDVEVVVGKNFAGLNGVKF